MSRLSRLPAVQALITQRPELASGIQRLEEGIQGEAVRISAHNQVNHPEMTPAQRRASMEWFFVSSALAKTLDGMNDPQLTSAMQSLGLYSPPAPSREAAEHFAAGSASIYETSVPSARAEGDAWLGSTALRSAELIEKTGIAQFSIKTLFSERPVTAREAVEAFVKGERIVWSENYPPDSVPLGGANQRAVESRKGDGATYFLNRMDKVLEAWGLDARATGAS